MKMSSIVAVLVAAALGYGGALWLNRPEPQLTRGPDGQLDLSAPAPRLNGKPNISGLWQAERTPTSEFVRVVGPGLPAIQPDLNDVTKHFLNVFWDMKPTEWPLKPEAVAPGIDAALAKAQAAIDVIAGRELSTVTYENTFLALEQAY